jgi:hypothetical protein
MLEKEESIGAGLLTTEEAEVLLKLKRHTLRQWRVLGKGPSYIKDGSVVRYSRIDLEAWADLHRVEGGV